MSDYFSVLITRDATAEDAPRIGEEIIKVLIDEKILLPEPIVGTGPEVRKYLQGRA